jgi:hypothetical protein
MEGCACLMSVVFSGTSSSFKEMEGCCWFKVLLVQKETIPRIRGFLFSISVSVGSMHTVLPTGTMRDLRVYMCTLKVVPISNESYLHVSFLD